MAHFLNIKLAQRISGRGFHAEREVRLLQHHLVSSDHFRIVLLLEMYKCMELPHLRGFIAIEVIHLADLCDSLLRAFDIAHFRAFLSFCEPGVDPLAHGGGTAGLGVCPTFFPILHAATHALGVGGRSRQNCGGRRRCDD